MPEARKRYKELDDQLSWLIDLRFMRIWTP
jgi:hypothetical protein